MKDNALLRASAHESVPLVGYSPDTCWIVVAGRAQKTTHQTLAGSSEMVLGRARANLEPTWGELGPTWSQLGSTWANLWPTWKVLGPFSANLSQLGAIFGTEKLEKSMIFIDFRIFSLCQPSCILGARFVTTEAHLEPR